jgi:hypothetical protein
VFGRRAKAVVLAAALLVLAVEGVLLVRYYDRYYGPDDASGAPSPTLEATLPEGTMPEGTMPEGTMPEGPALEETIATGDIPSNEGGGAFLHRATNENSRGDYTYLSDPAIDADADAVVLVVSSKDAAGDDYYGHNLGVWYEFADRKKWAIFNQDLAAVPAGARFRVVLPPASESLVHRAGPTNTVDNATYIDDPLTNGEPDIVLLVTQNWNPGGGVGVYNDHPVGVLYDEDEQKWAVYNRDGAQIPDGAAFNLAVSESEPSAR